MIRAARRKIDIYLAMAGMVPKMFLAYRAWFWVGIVLNVIAMAIFVYFWRAVYDNTASIAGLNLQQTLNYILLARIFGPVIELFILFELGYHLREGGIAHVLLRPLDMQLGYYAQFLTILATQMIWQIPMALIATFIFGLQWPSDPAVWGAFLVSVLLGRTIIFFFDWLLSCLTFYTTEIWGLGVMLEGASMFLSGSLVPLVMMPGWLQTIAQSFPFAQGLYVPLSLLTGIVPLSDAPRVWLSQLVWIIGLGLLSRFVFKIALRKVTVQGG